MNITTYMLFSFVKNQVQGFKKVFKKRSMATWMEIFEDGKKKRIHLEFSLVSVGI